MRPLSAALFLVLAFPGLAQARVELPSDELEALARQSRTDTPGLDAPVRFSAELATSLSRGNTETLNVAGSLLLQLALGKRWISESRARALYEESFDQVTANAWGVNQRFDRFVSESVSGFAAAAVERDAFAGIDWRWSGQLGVGWLAVQNRDETREDLVVDSLKFEAGFYGAIEELALPPNAAADAVLLEDQREIYAGRVAASYLHAFRKGTSVGVDLELIQDFNDIDNTVVVGQVYATAGMAEGVALKFTLLDRFDNVPAEPALEKNDVVLTAGIVVSI